MLTPLSTWVEHELRTLQQYLSSVLNSRGAAACGLRIEIDRLLPAPKGAS